MLILDIKYKRDMMDLALEVRNKIEQFIRHLLPYNSNRRTISIYIVFGYCAVSHQIGKIKSTLNLYYYPPAKPQLKLYHFFINK